MNNQQKFKKKKEREKLVRKKLLKQREELRSERAEQRAKELKFEEEYELLNGKTQPFLKNPEAIAAREARKKVSVEKRLQNNLAILEALEKKFDEEQQRRKDLNEKLEAEGHKTVKEKLDALIAKAKGDAVLAKTEQKED